ncbi:hypothetical protein [Bosea sp. (in: a-proteobacteria)]|uniref:hypothetical protein n=1 Tax=Bosea sp. (in: a-proteobacteria) TaxID=1871050 RepID=UPI0025C25A92|nr:hypothetical protein [Bosea sp. (in: a-proteobacteria)]
MSTNTDTAILYTVFDPNSGEVHGRGLTVEEAGMKILKHDGRTYEIEADTTGKTGRGWIMSRAQDSGGKRKSLIGLYALADTAAEALPLLAAKAVKDIFEDGRNPIRALTDELYDKRFRKGKG